MECTTPQRAVAIICEYNPLHTGHLHQIAMARRDSGADIVLCIMSEQLTQRGELAIADPYTRAEMAVRGGADIVVTLPFPYSGAAAEHFAAAGVYIADALGASYLHFGSECGDLPSLQRVGQLLLSPEYVEQLTAWQQEHPNIGVMEARERVLTHLSGDAALPQGSNDLLGITYLSAISRLHSSLVPLTTPRIGQAYRDDSPGAVTHASASAIRRLWRACDKQPSDELWQQIPSPCREPLMRAIASGFAPVYADTLTAAIQAFLRLADAEALSAMEDLGGGVANHLLAVAKEGAYESLTDLIAAAATKRYTNARLARAIWFGMCGVRPEDVRRMPAYTKLLACSRRGTAYLRTLRKSVGIPIVTKPVDIPQTDAARRQYALELAFSSLYTLALPIPRAANLFLKSKPYIEKAD